jgi:hypothetical protein
MACSYQIMTPFVWLLVPIYACLKPNSNLLKKFNWLVTLALYLPISIVELLVFMSINLASLPFAYFAAIVTKIRLINRFGRAERSQNAQIIDLLAFVAGGWLFLLTS